MIETLAAVIATSNKLQMLASLLWIVEKEALVGEIHELGKEESRVMTPLRVCASVALYLTLLD